MPYHADNLTPEQQEEVSLLLQGGLKGRFAREFGVIQGYIDALERYLAVNARPAVYAGAVPLVDRALGQLTRLERLADHAADLATKPLPHDEKTAEVIELAAYLRAYAEYANQELARLRYPARVQIQADADFYLRGDPGTLNGLLANLISNSVRAQADATVSLCLDGDGGLLYRDTGPGLTPEQRALLEGGATCAAALASGSTGLLLVTVYAAFLGWPITLPPTGHGMAVRFDLGAPEPPLPAVLHSAGDDSAYRAKQMEACLRREFAAVLPPLP